MNCSSVLRFACKLILILFVLLLVVLMLIFYACTYHGYGGEHRDLYTVAVHNLFGINGYINNGELLDDSVIEIIEIDDYGRVLFFYDEFYDDFYDESQPNYGRAFVIMQKAEKKNVYYYQDDCYIPCLSTEENFEQLWANVDENIIEELKALNDWNKEFDESKCTKAKISKKMPKSELDLQDYQFFRPIKSYVETEENPKNDNFQCQYFLYCNSDSSGKELYYVCTRTGYHYAVIVNADGSFSDSAVVEVDPTTYHKRIKELKQQNGWR